MKTVIPFFLLGLIALFSCQKAEKEPFNRQTYTINISEETLITTPDGVEFIIPANSLEADKEEVEIYITIALDMYSMVKNELYTLTEDNRMLESGGMISLEAEEGVNITSDSSIRVKIPTKAFNPKMSIFQSEMTHNGIRWKEKEDLIHNESMLNYENGKRLFEERCSACHRVGLMLVGPPLAHVAKFRDSAFLYQMTRNMPGLIMAGDPLALCLWERNYRQMMSPNLDLTDKEISEIYNYIETEAAVRGVPIDSTRFIDSCLIIGNDQMVFFSRNGFRDTLDRQQSWDSSTNSFSSFNSFSQRKIIKQKLFKYEFDISEFGWFNVDYFFSHRTFLYDIDAFEISLHEVQTDDAVVLMIFKN